MNDSYMQAIGDMMLIRAKNNMFTSVVSSKLIVNCVLNDCYYIHYDDFGVGLFYVLWKERQDSDGKQFAHILDITLAGCCQRLATNPLLPFRWHLSNIMIQRTGKGMKYYHHKNYKK